MMHPENTPDLFALGGISEEERKTLYSLDMGAGDGSSGCSVCIDLAAPEQSMAPEQSAAQSAAQYADCAALPCTAYRNTAPQRTESRNAALRNGLPWTAVPGCDKPVTAQSPRRVIHADMLALPFPDKTFDFVLSQCAFYVSGNPELALHEAMRVLKPGGKLLLSDVFFIDPERTAPWSSCITCRDITAQWREYYFRLLWDDEIPPCFENILNREKHAPRYYMLVYQKENFLNGLNGKNP